MLPDNHDSLARKRLFLFRARCLGGFPAAGIVLLTLLTLFCRFVDAEDRSPARAAPPPSTALADGETAALLAKISAHLGAVRSFTAAFVQEHHLAIFLDVLKARGANAFQAPDRFRWEVTEPYHSLLIYDRGVVAKFEERDGRMQPVDSGAADLMRDLMGRMTSWMRGDFQATRESFTLQAREGQEYALEMTPKAKEMLRYIQRIELYLSKDPLRIVRIVIREPEEDRIEIRFENLRENGALGNELFDTKNPPVIPSPHGKP